MSEPGPFGPPPQSPNPFQASQVAPATPPIAPTGSFQFEYMRAYNYIFENPNWLMNVVWWSVCILVGGFIPIVPYLVIVGHMFEIVESLYITKGTRYPDFDPNRFAEYLGRGIWPFLVALIVVLPLVVVSYIGIVAVAFGAMAAGAVGGDDLGPVLAVMVFVLGMFAFVAFMLIISMLVTPLYLRAGLMQDFGGAFDFAWAMDFVKKTWVEMILAFLFIQFSGIVIMLVGLMALCIGIYPANAIMLLAQTYIVYQLYVLYLSRGGTPIPLKPRMPMPQPGFAPPPQQY